MSALVYPRGRNFLCAPTTVKKPVPRRSRLVQPSGPEALLVVSVVSWRIYSKCEIPKITTDPVSNGSVSHEPGNLSTLTLTSKVWLPLLCADARQHLCAVQLPEECQGGLVATPAGTLPINAEQLTSLLEVFRRGPDPRGVNTSYRTGPVLARTALALLAGRRDIAESGRFATTQNHPQRRRLRLPLKKGTRAFY